MPRIAMTQWGEGLKLGTKSSDWSTQSTSISCVSYMMNYRFTKARSKKSANSGSSPEDCDLHIQHMEKLANETGLPASGVWSLQLPLAFLYGIEGRPERARDLIKNLVVSGISLLFDDDPDNDIYAYTIIGETLLHINDELNALSALSLIGPPQRYSTIKSDSEQEQLQSPCNETNGFSVEQEVVPSAEQLDYWCDGKCNKALTFSDSIWFCKVCNNVQFCNDCLKKVQSRTLSRYVCGADHEWLLVPSWLDEFKATGIGKVRVGGEMKDGKRVGGHIVTVDEWRDELRNTWMTEGIVQEEEEKEEGEGEGGGTS